MKKLSVLLALLVIGCATATPGPVTSACPPEDAFIIIVPENGPEIATRIPKDFFGDKENWTSRDELEKYMKQQGGL